ncbi:GDP-mannose 4,6-dehydratase [Aquirufa sp. OSTEICH-129V]|uniref:GDP-mannose 4,6-dehydratase n=1 Tax=Aquirufa avitistagni TaxID=3104728 RepID=A0ABW6DBQ4_9BACT
MVDLDKNLKKAFILGCDGQDGRLLSKLLRQKSYEVIGLSRAKESINLELSRYISFDLLEDSFHLIEDFIRLEKPDEIYYFAAYHKSAQESDISSWEEAENSARINYLAFIKILGICEHYSPLSRILYTSSSLIYSNLGIEIQDENSNFAPNCLYSLNKVASMEAANWFKRTKNLFISVAIMYNHESALRSDKFLSKKIINQVKQYLSGDLSEIQVGDLNAITDWGYALDYVEACWHILQQENSGSYIVSSGVSRTVRDWFTCLEEIVGQTLLNRVKEDKSLLLRSKPALIGDNRKLLDSGWDPAHSFFDMVRKIYFEEI